MKELTHSIFSELKSLHTPIDIQDFLDSLGFNYEKKGETCMSPLRVMEERKAHCIEGALLACVCLMLQKEQGRIVNLKVADTDYDHIITIFKKNGYYGAISKTNHVVLRYRDPVYRSVRELVMSYFHEYYLTYNGKKTLQGYTNPINVRRFGTHWILEKEHLWGIAEKVFDTPIIDIIPQENKRYIRSADSFEQKIAAIPEWK